MFALSLTAPKVLHTLNDSKRDHSNLPTKKTEIIVEAGARAKQWQYALVLTAVAGLAFFVGLGSLGLAGPDEPRYAEVAREMFASGDYISPRLCGCLWFEKPPLLYWMEAAAYYVFGVNEFAARIPSAIAATVAALFLFHAIARTVSIRIGAIVSIILITSAIFVGYGRAAAPDMPLTACIVIALCSVYLAVSSAGRARKGYLVIAAVGAGLSLIAKGLVGIALIATIFILVAVVTRQRFLKLTEIVLITAVFLLVSASWYLPVTLRHGWEFIREFVINHHFKRYLTNEYHHPEAFYFYLIIAVIGAIPWIFYLIPAIARLRRVSFRGASRLDLLLLLAWIWFLVPILFFSLSVSKLPGYILPSFPALAIIVGVEIEALLELKAGRVLEIAVRLTALLLIALGIAYPIYLNRALGTADFGGAILRFVPLAIACGALLFLALKRMQGFVAGTGAFTISLALVTVALFAPYLSGKVSLRDLSQQAATALRPGERIAFYLDKEYAAVFYAQGRVVCGVGDGDVLNAYNPDELVRALRVEKSMIVITYANKAGDLETDSRLATETIAAQGREVALRLSPSEK